ncbi:MAG: hypothetical protein AB8E15_06995 [Bdellovibrionales bacterium]
MKIFMLVLLTLLTQNAFSQISETKEVRRSFITLRSVAMGGAIVSASDDFSAVMYNPANLAALKESELNMGFGGALDTSFTNFLSDISDAASQTGPAQDIAIAQVLLNNQDETFYFNAPMVSGITAKPNWGFAFIPINSALSLTPRQTGGGATDYAIEIEGYLDALAQFSYGRKYNEKIDWGVAVKSIFRTYVASTTNATDINGDDFFGDSTQNAGITFDVDLAMNYKFGEFKGIQPKASVVIRNLLDWGYTAISEDDGNVIPKLARTLDLGSEFELKKFWVFTPRITFDIRDIGVKNWDIAHGYHIGAELDWKAYDWLQGAYRIGINKGYFSAGITAQFAWFRLDLASWGEEIGLVENDQKKESRRVALNMSLDF